MITDAIEWIFDHPADAALCMTAIVFFCTIAAKFGFFG